MEMERDNLTYLEIIFQYACIVPHNKNLIICIPNLLKDMIGYLFYYEINYELIKGMYNKEDTNYFLDIFETLNNKKKFPHERIFESFDYNKKDLPNFLNDFI